MKTGSVVEEKSYAFALRVVKMYPRKDSQLCMRACYVIARRR